MANFYVSSAGWTAVTAWSAGSARALNSYTRQTAPAVNSERVFKATSISGTGTTGGVEPTWNLTSGATTTDNAGANQIVWTEVTGKESEQASASWNAPAARVAAFPSGRIASNDYVFVSQDHAETDASALTVRPNTGNVNIVCVNRTGTVPPVSADLATSATMSATGANSITIGNSSAVGVFYVRGVIFQAGSVASSASISIVPGNSGTSPAFILDNCGLKLNNTNSGSEIDFGNTSGTTGVNPITLISPTITFGHASQTIQYGRVNVEWHGGSLAGTAPTALFSNSAQVALSTSTLMLKGVDLSTLTGSIISAALAEDRVSVLNCQLNAATTITNAVVTSGKGGFLRVDNSDDSGNGRNYRFAWSVAGGIAVSDITAIRTGGATDDVTSYSWKLTTNADPRLAAPAILFPMAKRYNTTGSSVTATVYFIANAASALTNAQIWLEIEALTTSGIPISAFANNAVADVLPSTTAAAQTTDTSAWNTGAAARQNTHAYVTTDVISVASAAAGTLWYCITAGTSSGSEPVGYTGATDGTSVTDGTAVFRAGRRQKLTVSFTPRVKGFIKATIKMAVASTTVHIDPTLSIA